MTGKELQDVKIHKHIQGIRLVCSLLPVAKIIIETAEFDLQLLKAKAQGLTPPQGVEYQHGANHGFWSTSGYGDGAYPVFAQKDREGNIFALEIRF